MKNENNEEYTVNGHAVERRGVANQLIVNAALGYGLFRDCKDNLKRWAPELTANTEAKIARHANQYFSGRLLMAGRGAGTLLLMTAYFQHIVHLKHESSTTTTQADGLFSACPSQQSTPG